MEKIDNAQSYFSIKLINEEIDNEDYSRQVTNDNGDVYIISAVKREQYNNFYK